jgi:hypothetical protein
MDWVQNCLNSMKCYNEIQHHNLMAFTNMANADELMKHYNWRLQFIYQQEIRLHNSLMYNNSHQFLL